MNDSIDEWLSSLGIAETPHTPEVPSPPTTSSVITDEGSLIIPDMSEEPSSTALSTEPMEDVNDILAEFGFNEIHEVEAEDVTEESEEEEEEEEEEDTTVEESQETTEAMPEVIQPPLIQPNSPTLLLDETTSRFSGAEWFSGITKQKVILAGLGGIGSWTALQLARMTPESIFLYDNDDVEAVNMSGQLYGHKHVGRQKVDAIADIIHKYTSARNIYAINERFTLHTEPGNIMICGFDNMDARKTFFTVWQTHVLNKPAEERRECLYLDGRLSMDTLQVLCIKGDDEYNMDRYASEFLFSGAEADATVCSMKQTSYLACMIGSFMVNLFTNFVAGQLDPVIPYDLPFFTEYDAQNMLLKIEH